MASSPETSSAAEDAEPATVERLKPPAAKCDSEPPLYVVARCNSAPKNPECTPGDVDGTRPTGHILSVPTRRHDNDGSGLATTATNGRQRHDRNDSPYQKNYDGFPPWLVHFTHQLETIAMSEVYLSPGRPGRHRHRSRRRRDHTAAALAALSPAQDVELRLLWSEYLVHADAHAAAQEKQKPARAAFDAEFPPCPDDVLPGEHWRAHNWLWRKHGLDHLSDAWNAAGSAMCETAETILQTEAAGLFGIGVKLAALPAEPDAGRLRGCDRGRAR